MPRLALPLAAAALAGCAAPQSGRATDTAAGAAPPAAAPPAAAPPAAAPPAAAPAAGSGAGAVPTQSPVPEQSPVPASPPDQPPAGLPPAAIVPSAPDAVNPVGPPPSGRDGELVQRAADVRELWSAHTSGLEEPRRQVVRTAAEWARVAAQLPGVPRPDVDFATHMLVVVALGTRPTGGHAVHVTGFARRGSGATITVTATQPGPDCVTTQALTSPAVVARVPRATGTVEWRERAVAGGC